MSSSMNMNWGDLYFLREVGRQRREAAVAFAWVHWARATFPEMHPERLRVERAALHVLLECPLCWGAEETEETASAE
jgi:hypothetical protein